MDESDIGKEIRVLLEEIGADSRFEGGLLRFRLKKDALEWDASARLLRGHAIFYGRYPFTALDRDAALLLCSKVNARLVRGAFFLPADAHPVFRTWADMDDSFGARKRLLAALEYNAEIISYFWTDMSTCGNIIRKQDFT